MRYAPHFVESDPDEVRRLVRENPWATIVSNTAKGLVASHYPVMLDEDSNGITLLSHVGRPDERNHELGQHEVLVIVQGPHGYVSPGWYGQADQFVPTWNHVTAHLYGTPQLLSDEENFRVLGDLVDAFESRMPEPVALTVDDETARHIATGTVGIRIPITRFDARRKLSQNKSTEVVDRIVHALEGDGPYSSAPLAAEMRRVSSPDAGDAAP